MLQKDGPPQGGPRNIGPLMLRFVLVFLLAIGTAAAQPGKKQDGGRDRQMSREERQRMREDVRDAYRDRARQERPQRSQQMTQEERVKLRRDIEDANRNLKR